MTTSVAIQIEAPRVVVRPRQAVKTKTVETQTEEIQMEQDPVFSAEKSICAVYRTVRVILHVSGRAAVGPGTNGPEEKEKQKKESEIVELCLQGKMYIVLTCK